MSRVIGIFHSQEQASAVIDDLKGKGFDRRDMIVSDLSGDAGTMNISIKNETDSLTDNEDFAQMNDIHDESGIIVSVHVPTYKRGTVAEVMRQRGAVSLRLE
ncbi:MAG: hypothetical protein Q8S19_07605 [Bacillota bacterium]|nr:hypothetical protein [Bacillota bacterium]